MEHQAMVTILTPTYNRANTLPKLIDSLCNQTCMDFEWLVIDDGSTDDTEKLVEQLKTKKLPFQWEYHKKENGGKHTALNFSHKYIRGKLVLMLDSDDYLTEDAVATICEEWPKYESRNDIGIINYFRGNGQGEHYSAANKEDPYIDDDIHYRVNHRILGDRCEVIRADIFKRYFFPEYPGERFMAESWLFNMIAQEYKTVYRNKIIYICEYLEGGLTKSGRALRMKCPLGMMDDCRSYLNDEVCLKVRIKEMLLYWVYAKCAGYTFGETLLTSKRPFGMTMTAIPGSILYNIWKHKYLE